MWPQMKDLWLDACDLFTALWTHAINQPHGGLCQMWPGLNMFANLYTAHVLPTDIYWLSVWRTVSDALILESASRHSIKNWMLILFYKDRTATGRPSQCLNVAVHPSHNVFVTGICYQSISYKWSCFIAYQRKEKKQLEKNLVRHKEVFLEGRLSFLLLSDVGFPQMKLISFEIFI